MAIDAYALCPGGTGKKIKFCCPDLLPELEKLSRMIEGEQHLAALQHIERLEQQGHPRACLMAYKATLLRETNQFEAGKANAEEFVKRFPDNPLACAESAMHTALVEGGRAAMPKLQRAIALSEQQMLEQVYQAIGIVAQALVEEGDWFAGRALLHLQMLLAPDDQAPMQQVVRMNRSPDIPLLMKSEFALELPPEGAAWRERVVQALAPLERLHWQECADNLAALVRAFPQVPVIWQNLAILRGWLADDEGAMEAWREYAALAAHPEDAAEAEALAMMLSKDPLGDAVFFEGLSWTVRDAERLQESLLSDRRVVQVPFDPATLAAEDTPPPRFIGILLDRPVLESAEGLTVGAMPRVLGQAMLFGKQTDREARLEVLGLSAWDTEAVKTLLREAGGDAIDPEPHHQLMGQTSGSHHLLSQKLYPPRGISREQVQTLTAEAQRQAIMEKWPDFPLGILSGKTPREAAADAANHVRLLAAILLLEHWLERSPADFDLNDLRRQLGLPVFGPIDPAELPLERLSAVRLHRVIVEKLSDDDLIMGFNRAMLFNAREAMRKFARAVIERPSLANRPERFQAYNVMAKTAENLEQALAHAAEGRDAALAAGRSCAPWDLLELSFRFARGDMREAMQLVQHIQSRHMNERGVGETLAQMLVDVGILRPDGTPNVPVGRPEAAMAQEPAAEAGRLWTPGGESTGGGGGKLWTPD